MVRVHHVQITMPAGGEVAARAFYAGVLGMAEMEKTDAPAEPGGCWFRRGELELHVTVEERFHPSRRTHPAVLVDDLDEMMTALRVAGHDIEQDELFPGHRRAYIHDPFGNRLALLQPLLSIDDVAIDSLSPDHHATWSPEVVAVYQAAFAPPPYRRGPLQVRSFAGSLRRHVERPGYVAFAARNPAGTLVGFTYGYTTTRGQWWHDQVRKVLVERAAHWLTDAFEYVELAVDPGHRRLGIGRRLHDRLLAAQLHPRAVLTTLDQVTAGRRLYERSGWRLLSSGFRFEQSATRYAVMGLEPARPSA